jgi:hypothetical protein
MRLVAVLIVCTFVGTYKVGWFVFELTRVYGMVIDEVYTLGTVAARATHNLAHFLPNVIISCKVILRSRITVYTVDLLLSLNPKPRA